MNKVDVESMIWQGGFVPKYHQLMEIIKEMIRSDKWLFRHLIYLVNSALGFRSRI